MLTIQKLFSFASKDEVFISSYNIPQFILFSNSFFLVKKFLFYYNYYGSFTRLDYSSNFSVRNFSLSEFVYHNKNFYFFNQNFFNYSTGNINIMFFKSLILPSKFNIILSYVKHFISSISSSNDYPAESTQFMAGYGNTTSAVNAIQFKFDTGNIDDGTILMYGIV